MIKINRTHTIRLIFVLTLISTFISCAKWDEFKEYIKDGEVVYVGKLDSVKVFSGNERILVQAQVKPDPKIKKALMKWNDGKDSVILDITHNSVLEHYIPMAEGIVSLELFTIDDKGNRSVAVPAIGRAYGPRYSAGLSNKLIASATIDNDNKAIIDWQEMDLSAGPIGTQVQYESSTGTKTILVPVDQLQTVISDLAATTKSVSYRTLFLPQKTSIDTFYTDFSAIGLAKDVTSEYLKNYKNPVTTIARSGRWAIPADWVTNTAVHNFRDGSGAYFGGVDYDFGGPFLAMEAGWSGNNMSTITNGKIYQTVTLPPGNYTFEMDIPDCTAGGDFYTVAALGGEIPNTENVSSALGFLKTNSPGTHALKFTLLEPKQVSLGFVGNLENKGGGDGTFWRINAVRLKQIVIVQ